MPDSYKTTYVVPRDQVSDVAGFFKTCDNCGTCSSVPIGENAKTTFDDDSVFGGLFKDGEATVKFFPHVHDQYDNGFSARSTYVNGKIPRVTDGLTDYPFPDWEEAGGFYWKRRSPFFRVSPDADHTTNKFCNYLIKANFSTSFDDQKLNHFGGGSDRIVFLCLLRETDFAANSQGFTCNWPWRKPQYFMMDEVSGTSIESMNYNRLTRNTKTGSFYFYAKDFDIFWVEVWEYAARGEKNAAGTFNTGAASNQEMFHLNVHKTNNDSVGWSDGFCSIGKEYDGLGEAIQYQVNDNSAIGSYLHSNYKMNQSAAAGVSSTTPTNNSYLYDFRNDRTVAGGYSPTESQSIYCPTLGFHNKKYLNLGVSDPINADWVRGQSSDPTNQSPETHNSVTVTLSKHLAIVPGFEVGEGVPAETDEYGEVTTEDHNTAYPNETYGFAPSMSVDNWGHTPLSHNLYINNASLEQLNYIMGEMTLPNPSPYGPAEGAIGEFNKNYTEGDSSDLGVWTPAGKFLAGTNSVEN